MRKFYAVLAVLAFVIAFSFGAQAQTMTTDIVFLKGAYIPTSVVTFDEAGAEDADRTGFAIQGEYNLNFNNFWLGFGLEYQRLTEDGLSDAFIVPMISAKIAAMGGLYIGGGLSGKYLISTEADESSGAKWTKKIDLWANGIIGYYIPIAEAIFFNLEGRFGYNLTNNQYSEYEFGGSKFDIENKSAYDIAFYAGIGYRASMSDY